MWHKLQRLWPFCDGDMKTGGLSWDLSAHGENNAAANMGYSRVLHTAEV